MTTCCFTRGAQCICQPQDGTLCPHITPGWLTDLAEALDKAAEVRGTVFQQADWQRIAQHRAATILRYFALEAGASLPPMGGGKGGKQE